MGSYAISAYELDTTAPTISSFSPADGATGVAIGSNIVLTFSEAVARGTGNIEIRSGSATGTLVESFNAATSTRLTVSGNQITIDPTNNLGNGTQYFVVLAAGSIKDAAGNNFAGNSTYDFTTVAIADTTAPTISSFSPADGATGVAIGSNIVLTFSEAVARGTGNIEIRSGSATGTLVESFNAATSTRLTVSGNQITIDPTNNLGNGTQYFVVLAAGSIKDAAGNNFAGNSTYDFTTVAIADTTAPTISSFSPADGATGVAIGSNIVLTFSEAVARGTGNIEIRSGSATGTLVESFNAATSTRLTVSGNQITIDPTNNLGNGTQYFVVLAAGSIKDAAGNNFAGNSTYDFTTISSNSTINGTGNAEALVGTVGADSIYGFAGNDTITGGAGIDFADGGEGSDLYIVASPSDHASAEFSDSGVVGNDEVRFSTATTGTLMLFAGDTGIERIVIGTGTAASAITTGTAAINVNASALTYGTSITGNSGANSLVGGTGNDTLTGNAGKDTLNGGLGGDSMIGGAGSDTFVFSQGQSGQTVNSDSISDYAKGAAGTGDLIDYTSSLTVGGSASAASGTQASISATSGIASFAASSGTTLADALADIAARFSANTDTAGEFAFFKVNAAGSYYLFISDGAAGVTSNDLVIQLVGVTTVNTINLASGNLTILT